MSTTPDDGTGEHAVSRPRRRRVAVGVMAGVLLVLVAAGAWLTFRVLQVAGALEDAAAVVRPVRDDIARGETEAAAVRLGAIDHAAAEARAGVADPVWRVASALPWLGDQLGAVEAVVEAFALVADEVLPALVVVGGPELMDSLQPVDGQVDLAPLAAAAPRLEAASRAAAEARDRVGAVDTGSLLGPLAVRVEEAHGVMSEAAQAVEGASTVATLVPPMLGADAPRSYLVLVLNPAELRSGGGIAGTAIVLTADRGQIELAQDVAAKQLPDLTEPILPLTDEEVAVRGDRLGLVLQNVTMTPDFPRSAELAAAMWVADGGAPVDGALAIDPVSLGYVLEVVGPVTEPTGDVLDAGNVVDVLLHDTYVRFPDGDDSDLYFSGAAGAVFDAFASLDAGLPATLPAVSRSAAERRVSLWSSHEDEQQVLAGTVLGGAFLSGAADDAAGVFLDDASGSKLGYYLDVGLRVDLTCQSGDATAATVTLDLASALAADAAAELPAYVVGAGYAGVEPGVARHNLTFYAPVGGALGAVHRDGMAVGTAALEESGREVVVVTSTLAPGESESWSVDIELAAPAEGLDLWSTPALTLPGHLATACP